MCSFVLLLCDSCKTCYELGPLHHISAVQQAAFVFKTSEHCVQILYNLSKLQLPQTLASVRVSRLPDGPPCASVAAQFVWNTEHCHGEILSMLLW